MSKGGSAPKSPRHSLIVRKCWRFSSSTCATMHKTFGRSPLATSYSKSQTTTGPKLLIGLLSSNQTKQSGVAFRHDQAVGKAYVDECFKILLRPFRFRERIRVVGELDLITFNTIFTPTDLRP